MEAAWQKKTSIYGSSWDIKKAFDSVSKHIIRLAWQRLGVPEPIVEWLLELDRGSRNTVRTSWAGVRPVEEIRVGRWPS